MISLSLQLLLMALLGYLIYGISTVITHCNIVIPFLFFIFRRKLGVNGSKYASIATSAASWMLQNMKVPHSWQFYDW